MERLRPKWVNIEMDGVVADLMQVWVTLANSRFGGSLDPRRVQHYELDRHYPEAGKRVFSVLQTDGLFKELPVIDGAEEGVRTLRELGFRVQFSTTSSAGIFRQKDAWRRLFFPDTVDRTIRLERRTSQPCALAITAAPPAIMEYQEAGIPCLIFDQPWNQFLEGPRLYGWESIREAVAQLSDRS